MGPTPEQLRDRILEALSTLRVPITAEQLDNAIRVAEHRGDSHQAFLWELLGTAAIDRQERAIARRIREARFPNQGALEDFDWSFNASAIDRTQIEQLATGEWMSRTENLVMLGQSGVGKSRLLEGIGRRLCAIGKRVRYTTSGDLLTQLTASLADGTLPRQLSYWSNFDLLIIDEFGLDYVERKLDPQAGHLLFNVIAARASPSGGCGVRHHLGLRGGDCYVVGYPATARDQGSQTGLPRLKPRFAGWLASLPNKGEGCSPLGKAAVDGYYFVSAIRSSIDG